MVNAALPASLLSGVASRSGRTSKGTFAPKWPDFAVLNKQAAQRLQAAIVTAFDESLILDSERARPQRDTAYLRKALESAEMINYNVDGYTVLPDGYLDSTMALPYWRDLEAGTSRFVDSVLRGYFVTGGSFSAPKQELYGHDERFAGKDGASKSGKGAIITRAIQPHPFVSEGVALFEAEGGNDPLLNAMRNVRITSV